jgi:hypothetical protein
VVRAFLVFGVSLTDLVLSADIPLQLSDAYRAIFNTFSVHYAAQMRSIEDATLEAELGTLHQIINAPGVTSERSTGCCT